MYSLHADFAGSNQSFALKRFCNAPYRCALRKAANGGKQQYAIRLETAGLLQLAGIMNVQPPGIRAKVTGSLSSRRRQMPAWSISTIVG